MTKNEAKERAAKIWGDRVVDVLPILYKGYKPQSGDPEWQVLLPNGVWRQFDCNGHSVPPGIDEGSSNE